MAELVAVLAGPLGKLEGLSAMEQDEAWAEEWADPQAEMQYSPWAEVQTEVLELHLAVAQNVVSGSVVAELAGY